MAEREQIDVCPTSSQESDSILQGDEKKPLSRPDSATSGHNTYIISSSVDVQNTGRPELLVLKLDERQRLARERREGREKQNAVREAQLLEREERARLYYEKQLEDRRRRLEEQRIKEDRRRTAVEEKRRQNLEEEKARYEAVVRRTLEKSQRVRPKQNRWSWGGTLNSGTSHHSDADRRSVSTMNLSKHIHPVMNKRLSSSSATLLSSPVQGLQKQTSLSSSCLVTKVPSKARASREKIYPDRPAGMRRLPLTPWESNVVSRLQTPTHSYLARSRSAICLSGDAASCHQTSSLSIKIMQPCSAERPIRAGISLERAVGARPDANQCRRATQSLPVDRKDKDYVRKSWTNLSCPTPTLTIATTKRAPSPGSQRTKVSQPSSTRSSTKPPQRSPASKRSRTPPPPSSVSLSPSIPSLLPGNLRPGRVTPESPRVSPEVEKALKEKEEAKREEAEGSRRQEEEKEKREQSEKKAAAEISTRKAESNGVERVASPPTTRTSVGTTDPEEASRLLTEKRRQAREQREKEEEEKRQQEEAERQHREEIARKIAEERAKREEEAQRLAEEKKSKEEEERRLEEERQQREREEEAERMQRQKEQEEARQREEAERLRQEREKHFQKEEAERLERKKRLEEIMKRTRRSDQKSSGQTQGNGDASQQNSQDVVNVVPGIPSITVSAPQTPHDTQHSDGNGHTNPELSVHTLPSGGHESSTEALQENGVVTESPSFEEVIEVPTVTKLSRQEGDGEEEDERRRRTPLLAFRENGSTHDLSEWDQSRVQQHAGDV